MKLTSATLKALNLRKYCIRILILAIFIFLGFLAYVNDPPTIFPTDVSFTIQSGDSLNSIAKNLKEKHLIRSTMLLQGIAILSAGEQKIIAGDYYFNRPISACGVVSRLMSGDFGLAPIRVTIQEGASMSQIAMLLSSKLRHFSVVDFMKYSPAEEGYLFPDTYFFTSDSKVDEIIDILQKNFEEKIKTIEPEIVAFNKSENEVITMASILEEEARTQEDWQIISGILWKRIELGMPLQVDSTLTYVTGRISSELTTADLKMDSPYNTYIHKGLPPTPIVNPGIKTIIAAVTPIETLYLYYLSDENGVIHYAATFADHIKNREKYLK
jgi:UPF0755 protein